MLRSILMGIMTVLAAAMARADEFRPTGIYVRGETAQGHPAGLMLDGNPDTFAELLDDTRGGKDAKTLPPLGDAPVTASFVLDLGQPRKTVGMRLVSQKSRWLARMAYNVTVFTCGDAEGKTNMRVIAEKKTLPVTFCGDSAFVAWAPVTARFFGVRVNESDEGAINSLGTYMQWLNNPSRAIWGHPFSGGGRNFVTDIAEATLYDREPDDFPRPNPPDRAVPRSRLEKDWLLQDAGFDDFACAFTSTSDAELEKRMVAKVAGELAGAGRLNEVARFQENATSAATLREAASNRAELPGIAKVHLVLPDAPGCDPRWRSLYFRLCEERRAQRLRNVTRHATQIVYVTHYTFGCNVTLGSAEHVTDDLTDARPRNWTRGGQLCLLTIRPDGSVVHEVLIDKPAGCIRDPAVSHDGSRLVFAMRDSYNDNGYHKPRRWALSFRAPLPWDAYQQRRGDDYHLYVMDLKTRRVTQITRSPVVGGRVVPCAEVEPCFTSDGRIVFQSTRCEQVMPCHQTLIANLYGCDESGENLRRLAFDGASTLYPQQLDDGRILYTRWEYNDPQRAFSAIVVHHESRRNGADGILRQQLVLSDLAGALPADTRFDQGHRHCLRPSRSPEGQAGDHRSTQGDAGGQRYRVCRGLGHRRRARASCLELRRRSAIDRQPQRGGHRLLRAVGTAMAISPRLRRAALPGDFPARRNAHRQERRESELRRLLSGGGRPARAAGLRSGGRVAASPCR